MCNSGLHYAMHHQMVHSNSEKPECDTFALAKQIKGSQVPGQKRDLHIEYIHITS